MENKELHCFWQFEVIVFRPNNAALTESRQLQRAYSVLLRFLCVVTHAMKRLQLGMLDHRRDIQRNVLLYNLRHPKGK